MEHDTRARGAAAGAAPEAHWQRPRDSSAGVTPDPHEPPTEAFRSALRDFGELREYVSYFIASKTDAWKAGFRRIGIMAVLGVIALLAGGAFVVTAAVLLLIGIAQGLGRAMNGHYWAGNLIVGAALLLLIFGGGYWFVSRLFKSSRKATVEKYELRRTRQRAQFGHDVRQRAGQSL
jgi:hypothetical protein